jgi:hypothetical protein
MQMTTDFILSMSSPILKIIFQNHFKSYLLEPPVFKNYLPKHFKGQN